MNYYNEIKQELIDNEINKRVKDYSKNKYELQKYYNVGKILSKAGKHYGEGIIKEYSKKLTLDFGKGYTETNLKYFRQFYIFSKSHTVCDQLSWSHYRTLLSITNKYEIEYYISISKTQNLSTRQLKERIKSKEYERLPESTKSKIISKSNDSIEDYIKNPIIIKKNSNYEVFSEKVLQKLILEDIPSFLTELGYGFTFIDNEYKIKLGSSYNYIDLLLFNIKYNCYVVIELKIGKLKKEHIGQIEIYMNYIDENIKSINHDKTIGIIICKEDNHYVIKYCSDNRIISRTYQLI